MSLQVWLPLNGDLHNQGLKSTTVINHNTTFTNDGKLGKCCNIASGQYLGLDAANQNNHKYPYISIACWVYPTQSDSIERHIICSFESGGCGIDLQDTKFEAVVYVGGYKTCMTKNTITLNTWYHVCMTYDGSKLCLYVNGQLAASNDQVSGPITYHNTCPWQIGGNPSKTSFGSNDFIGKINDFRMYDHALSAKEVEEIAKGLALHYKLAGPMDISTDIPENLFIGSGFSQTDYNNMVANNNTTDWTKYIRWYNGNQAQHSFEDGVDTIKLNAKGNLGIAFVRKATDINLNTSSKYTISCEAKCSQSGAQLSIDTTYYTTANAWVWRGGKNKKPFTATDTWQTFTLTFTPDSNTQYICYCFTVYGTAGGTDTFSIRHCKLEKGTTATQWILNPEDDGYAAQIQHINSDNYTTEYDCSGYGHNATIIGTSSLEVSPRYNYGIYMNNAGTSNRIQVNEALPLPSDALTISFWAKYDKNKTMVLCAIPSCIIIGNTSTGLYFSPTNSSIKGGSTESLVTNEWNHIVVTKSGSTYQCYINGALVPETSKTGYWTHNGSLIYLLNRNVNNTYAATASISDFRIYTTILTADQVKELYNTSATIDKKGNIYAREQIENSGNINITKTGQLQSNEIIDNNTITTASFKKTDRSINGNTVYEY